MASATNRVEESLNRLHLAIGKLLVRDELDVKKFKDANGITKKDSWTCSWNDTADARQVFVQQLKADVNRLYKEACDVNVLPPALLAIKRVCDPARIFETIWSKKESDSATFDFMRLFCAISIVGQSARKGSPAAEVLFRGFEQLPMYSEGTQIHMDWAIARLSSNGGTQQLVLDHWKKMALRCTAGGAWVAHASLKAMKGEAEFEEIRQQLGGLEQKLNHNVAGLNQLFQMTHEFAARMDKADVASDERVRALIANVGSIRADIQQFKMTSEPATLRLKTSLELQQKRLDQELPLIRAQMADLCREVGVISAQGRRNEEGLEKLGHVCDDLQGETADLKAMGRVMMAFMARVSPEDLAAALKEVKAPQHVCNMAHEAIREKPFMTPPHRSRELTPSRVHTPVNSTLVSASTVSTPRRDAWTGVPVNPQDMAPPTFPRRTRPLAPQYG